MAKPKWGQGIFEPSNPNKYVGKGPIKYKSQWENTFMRFCDDHPNVKSWAYEPVKIPYYNPIKKKQSVYVPDFIVTYEDRYGKLYTEMIEIKPKGQAVLSEKTSRKERFDIALNHAKWAEAVKYCKHKGINFRVLTKDDIYVV